MSTYEKGATREPYHHGDLRRALVEATAAIVEKQGPGAVSLREAARAVGVSHNAPYRHFDSREALLAAVAAQGFEALGDRLARVADTADPSERLSRLGHAYVRFALENRGVYLLMFGSEIEKRAHPELMTAGLRALEILNRAVIGEGAAPPARLETIGAWALVHGLAHLIADRQLAPDLLEDEARDRLVDTVTRIFNTGLRSQSTT